MRNVLQKCLPVVVVCALWITAVGQGSSGSLSGVVVDPKGAVVAGATVTVKNVATSQENTTETSNDGTFSVPSLATGVYTATINASGFKQAFVTDIKVDVGKVSSINVELEIGSANETVTVVGGGELLQTQSATVGTTLTGRQITDLPTASRDALDLVLAMPGTTTVGRPRQSSVNGLPKGALNITIDGINVQDNLLKSNDGFFTYVRPRTDAISEVTVSTATPGAESSAEGAVQIKFVTQGGSNEYHGGVYWYHRNPALNANYWFNNRDQAPDPVTGKAPQARILLNQPGGKVGGPIRIPGLFNGRDKAFFFVNYEEYRLPEKTARTRNILSPEAQAGTFRFISTTFVPSATNETTCNAPVGTAGRICSTNVFGLAQRAGLAFNTPDPTVSSLLSDIRGSLSGLNIRPSGDPNIQQVTFNNTGGQVRKFPTVRFDFNVTKNHHIENVWNYQSFRSSVDFLNGVDPSFPGFPNFGSQDSNRFSNSTAWRWTINQNLVNEMRYGVLGGTSLFFAQVNAAQFENQGGYSLSINNFASGGLTLTNATVTNAPSRRHTPVRQFSDTLSWVKGDHSLSFGGNFTKITWWNQSITAVPTISFATNQNLDPAGFAAFSALGNQQGAAAQLYYVLAGRLNAVNANARLNEDTLKYSYLGDLESRAGQKEYGIFGQDTWRIRPNLTINYGVRWEVQLPFEGLNNVFATVSHDALFGESGPGNLFKPGTLTGGPSNYVLFGKGYKTYKADYSNFGPTVGIAWSPNFENGVLKFLGGQSGQTVLRAGYSRAFNREGVGVFSAVTGGNPGGTLTTNRSLTLGNLAPGTYLRQGPFAPPAFPAEPVYPNTGLITDAVNAFLPDLKVGHIDSWTLSFQRELTTNTVLEIRYIGNRGKDLWRQYDLNELNITENGVFAEWRLAQQNMLANIAANRCQPGVTHTRSLSSATNPATGQPFVPGGPTYVAGCQANFAFFGAGTGTSPLPISLGYFSGSTAATNPGAYTNANFRSTTFTNTMNPLNPAPLTFGNNLSNTSFDNRRTGANALFPYNHFLVNPGKRGGAFIVDNSGESYYDAMTIELRRRMSAGLLIQANYTFGKALGNTYASSSAVFDQPTTLRNPNLRRNVAPFDITHSLKANFIYELPVGNGRRFMSGANGWVNHLLGGWGFNGNIRIQSGNPFSLGNVQLVGMDRKELQEAVGIYRDPDGFIYVFPKDIRENTIKASNLAIQIVDPPASTPNVASTATILYTQGAPSGRFIAPAGFGNCQQSFGFIPSLNTPTTGGGCGFTNLVLKGPAFFRSDLSIVKRIRFTENTNLELRGEFLNAFNNINFLVGSAGNDLNTLGGFAANTFGRMTNAYQDLSTTNDPGGRLVQLVVRFNF